jgi:Fe-S-cluster containining protein
MAIRRRLLAPRFGIVLFLADETFSHNHRISPGASMSGPDTPRRPQQTLAEAAAAFQVANVIPHCTACSKPCCRLDALVLELEWKQVKTLWHLDESRNAFDKRLSAGQGPEEIRAGNGLYYIHSKPCPAYDNVGHSCTVYGQDVKPPGCTDFPVYEDGGCIIADLRCEAVNLDALVAWVAGAVGAGFRVIPSADEEFPFLVTLSVKRAAGGAGRKTRRG